MKKLAAFSLALFLCAALFTLGVHAQVRIPIPTDYPKDGNYYGHQLDDPSRTIYNYLLDAVDKSMSAPVNGRVTINMPIGNAIAVRDTKTWNQMIETYNRDSRLSSFLLGIPDAVSAFRLDHPEVFWLQSSAATPNGTFLARDNVPLDIPSGGTLNYGELGNGSYSYGVSLTFDVAPDWTGRNSRSISGDKALVRGWASQNAELMSALWSAGGDAYESLAAIHNWLVTHNSYNSAAAAGAGASRLPWTPLSAIDETLSPVCEGYAKAFKLACGEIGIPCILVAGTASATANGSEAHMWNAVRLAGAWYGVDVTWDDPASAGGRLYSGMENLRFFMVGSDMMYPDRWSPDRGRHVPDYFFVSTVSTDANGNPLDAYGRPINPLDPNASARMVQVQGNSDFLYPELSPYSYLTFAQSLSPAPAPAAEEHGPFPLSGDSGEFSDVPEGSWAYEPIQTVTSLGLFGATGPGTFSPNAPMTRAMLAQVFYNLSPVSAPGWPAGFHDVSDRDWYRDAVGWCAGMGILTGYPDYTFRPDTPVTREELAAVLMRYAQGAGLFTGFAADLSFYPDAWTIQDWAYPAVSWAVAAGLLSGTNRGLEPQAPATRAHAAAIMARFISSYGLI